MSQSIRAVLFAPHVNSNFAFAVPGFASSSADRPPEPLAVNLTLMEVSQEKACGPYTNFHLIFHGPVQFLPQAVYRVNHAEMGEQELFIVPIGDMKNNQGLVTGYQYQTCFSVKPAPAAN